MSGSNDRSEHPRDIEAGTATRLLHLGTYGRLEPVEQLIDRLGQSDGHQWFLNALGEAPLGASSERQQQAILEGEHSLEKLIAAKQEAKRLMSRTEASQSYLAALLQYFVTLASAEAHHHRMITRVAREEVEAALLDLAEIAPEQWSRLFSRAAVGRMQRSGE